MNIKALFKLIPFAACVSLFSCAAPTTGNAGYGGNYSNADSGSQLTLEVTQNGNAANVDFSAADASGRGTAPDGQGKGQIASDGSLKFTFEDSFGNKGSGRLNQNGNKYLLKMDVTSTSDPRALSHYGERILKKK